jgi:hypothetical protein
MIWSALSPWCWWSQGPPSWAHVIVFTGSLPPLI